MSRVEPTMPTSQLILIVIFFGVLIIFGYEAFKSSPGLSFMGLTIAFVLFVWIFVDNTEWNPLGVNANVIGSAGEIGTIVKPLEYIGNREYRIVVACKKRYVPDKRKGYFNSAKGLMSVFTGNTNIELTGYQHHFVVIPQSSTCPEGAVMYLKNFNGKPPKSSLTQDLYLQLEKNEFYLGKLATFLAELQGQMMTEPKESSKSTMDIIQNMSTIMRQLDRPQSSPAVHVVKGGDTQ